MLIVSHNFQNLLNNLQVFLHITPPTNILFITVPILLSRHSADNDYSQLISGLSLGFLTHIHSLCGYWINWGRVFHCLLSAILFRRHYVSFQKVSVTNNPSRRLNPVQYLLGLFTHMNQLQNSSKTVDHGTHRYYASSFVQGASECS